MNIFFTADHYFNHKRIIEYSSRPFKDIDEMNEVLIQKWNSKIKPKEIVYHLGDFAFGHIENQLKVLKRLNGSINFILGSHRNCGKKLIAVGWGVGLPNSSLCWQKGPKVYSGIGTAYR